MDFTEDDLKHTIVLEMIRLTAKGKEEDVDHLVSKAKDIKSFMKELE